MVCALEQIDGGGSRVSGRRVERCGFDSGLDLIHQQQKERQDGFTGSECGWIPSMLENWPPCTEI